MVPAAAGFSSSQHEFVRQVNSSAPTATALKSVIGGTASGMKQKVFALFAAATAALFASSSEAQVFWSASPLNPPGIPLAVRSPYVSVWQWGGNHDRDGDLTRAWAGHWNGNLLPWCGQVRVDGTVYNWMGTVGLCGPRNAVEQSLTYTATSTTIVYRAGPVDVELHFLSPITPGDLVRQSLPYSYLRIKVTPNDGQAHTVQMYSDIGAEWVCGDWSQQITWSYSTINGYAVHQAQLLNQQTYGEIQDFSLSGQTIYATPDREGLTYQSGPGAAMRSSFEAAGVLPNTQDGRFRRINEDTMAFAFAHQLGSIAAGSSATILMSVGHYRDPAASYTAVPNAYPDRSLYFMTQYPSLSSSLAFFMSDFDTVSAMSAEFDDKVRSESLAKAGAKYAAVTTLAARQVFAGMEITVGRNADGYDPADVMVFMKEIATANSVNTVDVVYPAHFFFLYSEPRMVRWLIEPIFRYVATGRYPNPWGIHDMGKVYPLMTGHDDGHDNGFYGIEESSNLISMAYTHAIAAHDDTLVRQHYAVLKGYGDWLVGNSEFPALQASTDDFTGEVANLTNLAVKGAVALRTLALIGTMVGETADVAPFYDASTRFAQTALTYGRSADGGHFKVTFQADDSSWATVYNLAMDKMLGLNLFAQSVYDSHANFLATVAQQYGIPLDSRAVYVKTDWAILASTSYPPATRDLFINGVWGMLDYGQRGQGMPDLYFANNASCLAYVARPVVGATYALLAADVLAGAAAAGR